MMDDEILQMYVEEASEHLGDIENDLLTVEQAGADIDEELVNKVFRAAHSIKGGAGFLGLTKIKDLGHKIENVLDMIRNRDVVPEPGVVNIILLAFDKLRDMILHVADSNDAYIDDHVQALTRVATARPGTLGGSTGEAQVEIKSVAGRTVFFVPKTELAQKCKGGKNLYLLEFDLVGDVHNKKKYPLDLMKNLEASGVVIDTSLDLEAVGCLEDETFFTHIPLYVLFASIVEEDIIPALIDLDSQFVSIVSWEETALPDVGAAPAFTQELLADTPETPPVDQTSILVSEFVQEVSLAPVAATPVPGPALVDPVEEAPSRKEEAKSAPASSKGVSQAETLRVHVRLLEDLMNLAGELVLSRNQLLQAISSDAMHQIEAAGQRIDLVTSELQEVIMLTRMQTVGTIFNKFPRVVRDLARSLGKDIDLQLEGAEVELDKTIIEGLGDPLTHLVRNCADHGIERPETRVQSGKPATGTIVLKAYHEAGQVVIEIIDDGQGLNTAKIMDKALSKGLITQEQAKGMTDKEQAALIFLPGLSTAENVTDVSGRGVGMDVVKSNLDQLGGQVDIETAAGKGTTIRIKLPLTLAIIPSLLVSLGRERHAIPQVNVDELLRIPVAQIRERLEMVGDAEVLVLRGELIPLLYLDKVLGVATGANSVSTTVSHCLRGEGPVEGLDNAPSDINLVVVSAGQYRYALVVDQVHDSVEIVVKPLGRHFKGCLGYAGATIMGDGVVALILDVAGLGRLGDLNLSAVLESSAQKAKEIEAKAVQDRHSLFMFRNAPHEQCAVPLGLVARVELIDAAEVEEVSGRRVIKYRGGTLPVFTLDQVAHVAPLDLQGQLVVIVFFLAGHEIGLLATPPVDAVELQLAIDTFTLKQTGIAGSAVINATTTLVVDIFELVEALHPEWFTIRGSLEVPADGQDLGVPHLLLVEDSDFFRSQVKKFIEGDGYTVDVAEDGVIAWNMLDEDPSRFDLVVTDIEMPHMDGFELARRIRQDSRFSLTPIVALTSLAGDEDVARGKAVGIDDYQVKLDKERLLQAIYDCLQRYAS